MHNSIWNKILPVLSETFDHSRFETWIKPLIPKDIDNEGVFTIIAPNSFYCQFLTDHYKNIILDKINDFSEKIKDITFISNNNNENNSLNIPKNKIINNKKNKSNLNKEYTFDNFVEGSSNQFAKSVSLAVAEAPGETKFNPLFIYSGVGLGKTHLMHAIGNYIEKNRPEKKITYVTSEEFYFDFIDSIQNNQSKNFSQNFRDSDILLIDDVQFFAGKDRTQEEFFYIFNTLYQNGKQIILSSDLPISASKGIQERLVSRFQWGLSVDIQPPDLETRIAILEKKAKKDNLLIPEDVLYYIAENVSSNIREIEGVIIKLLAFSSITRTDINLDVVKGILKNNLKKTNSRVSIDFIIERVANYYKVPVNNIREKNRRKEVAHCRKIAMYISKKLTNNSLKTIGLHFGGRDHSTVIHAISQIEKMKNKEDVSNDLKNILSDIKTNN